MESSEFGACEVTLTDSKVPCEEGRSGIVFLNKARLPVRKVKIDHCLVTDNTRRCDWLVIEPNDRHFHYVELKGTKILDGIEQIHQSILLVNGKRDGHTGESKTAYIVCTRVRPAMRAAIQKRKTAFEKATGTRLHIGSKLGPVKIS